LPDAGPESTQEVTGGIITLRSEPGEELSSEKVQRCSKPGISVSIVTNRWQKRTELIGQQSGSTEEMAMAGPPHYATKLNDKKFPSHSD
jgi:hypothetical protein